MPTYATAAQLRTYTNLTEGVLADAEANALLTRAEQDIDSIAVVDRAYDPATGRRFNPATLSTNEARILRRATCAQAEYRRVMGNDFFVAGQYASVSGPNYSTTGTLGAVGAQVWRELAGTGFIRLATTTAGTREFVPKVEEDFPVRNPRDEFELG